MRLSILCVVLAVAAPAVIRGQSLSAVDYRKALWMTTRMYGGQRSGEGPNWLVMDHGSGTDFVQDADGGHSLSGGWHDCGDHVKFGQTEFYSAYVLLKAYDAFPTAFDDLYSHDYHGYRSSGDFSWEGARGEPNGIPDVLDEVRYATDYFIKCAPDAATFYYQVGEGAKDHKRWVTSVKMASLPSDYGGQPRASFKNPSGASMASFCAASLALMGKAYRKFDPEYSGRCLAYARNAYAYAKAHPGTAGAGDGGFYPGNAKWQDDFACAAAELYLATGEDSFRTDAVSMVSNIGEHYWSLCYNNNDDLAAFCLGAMGSANAKNVLRSLVNRYKGNVTADGVGKTGNAWGILRYSASQAFSAALYGKLDGTAEPDPLVYRTVDYILGANSAGQSFVVGFGARSPTHPHHRNVFLNDDNVADAQKNSLVIPARNRQHGYMVGGTLSPGSFTDDINDYSSSEGGIDYNCGLVGALAGIVARMAPVDTNRFGGTGVSAAACRHEIRVRTGAPAVTYPLLASGRRIGQFAKGDGPMALHMSTAGSASSSRVIGDRSPAISR